MGSTRETGYLPHHCGSTSLDSVVAEDAGQIEEVVGEHHAHDD
jgi:hypothetical protein